jgi:leucyl/phenylalanyl-tRNA--protein transferase
VSRVPFLDMANPQAFPLVDTALDHPDGLLAAGGDLSPERLLAAYRRGIFPWYSGDQPILWWSPSSRTVYDTADMHVPRRLSRWMRRCNWSIRADTAFADVIRACAAPRALERGTWITPGMLDAYLRLHAMGHAHSVEAWAGDRLVGGVYGVCVGAMFFGESMFSRESNGSKVALLALCRLLSDGGSPLLDAQVASDHLFTLGAHEMSRSAFCNRVAELAEQEGVQGSWQDLPGSLTPADLA